MHPQDEVDFERWYREEHLDMLHKVPGHRRSLRYVLGPKVPDLGDLTEAPKFLAVHEYDSLDAQKGSPEATAARHTPWAEKHISDSTMNAFRMFELLKPAGF
jgi:hypothetical protein